MSIVGDHPETGIRLELERPRVGGPPWCYVGDVVTSSDRFPMRAVVESDGGVIVEVLDARAPAEVATKAKLIIRAAHKHASDEPGAAGAPPRRIVRWRGEK